MKDHVVSFDRLRNIILVDGMWQFPAATEHYAYKDVNNKGGMKDGQIYIAFPFATLIDTLDRNSDKKKILLDSLSIIKKIVQEIRLESKLTIVTCCQHIKLEQYIWLFKYVDIDVIFWSHKRKSSDYINDIRVFPFPLFPAQTYSQCQSLYFGSNNAGNSETERKYLVNFIGAYNPKIYLSDVRELIYQDEKTPGFNIVKREQWHFNRSVYNEQVSSIEPTIEELEMEARNRNEYINAIKDSWFTFCPSGSGPNSIRIWESLCLGSIPVIFVNDFELPLHDKINMAAILIDDSKEGYQNAKKLIVEMAIEDRVKMIENGFQLISKNLGPSNYCKIIHEAMNLG